MRKIVILLIFTIHTTFAQHRIYTMANAHSHNDYEQKNPFYDAYNLGFGSIEADLYLKNDELYVAHNEKDIQASRTFKTLYLLPLVAKIKENNGNPYPNKQNLQLLIDLKKNGKEILKTLFEQIKPYRKELKNVRLVISGDMPKPSEFKDFDKIFYFDGRKDENYSADELKRVAFYSTSFYDFDKSWTGTTPLDTLTTHRIQKFIKAIEDKGKGLRFWATPNTKLAYESLSKLNVAFIGTDSLVKLKNFIKKTP